MPTLYVIEPESRLEKEYGRLLVTKEDEVLLRLPMKNVSAVVLVGNVGATTQAMQALLLQGVPMFLVKPSGELLGQLVPGVGLNLPLRQAQYRRNDDPTFALQAAQRIVAGKIFNQMVLAKRLARRMRLKEGGDDIEDNGGTGAANLQKPLKQLEQACLEAGSACLLETLLGIEGNSARAYFDIYQQAFDGCWNFTKRTRRPPRDPVNALLSLGYTFLSHVMMAALQVVGLDPYLGYFHQEEYGRPALALDLIEEFRAPVVDSLVLTLINKRLLQAKDFEPGKGGGIYLTRPGLRIFLREFCDRLESTVTPRSIGRPISYRKLFEVQARRMAHVILGKEPFYMPFKAR